MTASNGQSEADYLRMPEVEPGMAVGLFGGSFNPPHEGHVLIAKHAIEKLKLDQLWWMVTPGNPLKDLSELPPLEERVRLCREIVDDARNRVTGFEAAHRLQYSADTIELVLAAHPDVHFVWVMGADSLATFHKWVRWEKIVETIPIAVYDRPGSSQAITESVMAKTYSDARVDESRAGELARMKPPAWVYIHGPLSPLSSTELRKAAQQTGKQHKA